MPIFNNFSDISLNNIFFNVCSYLNPASFGLQSCASSSSIPFPPIFDFFPSIFGLFNNNSTVSNKGSSGRSESSLGNRIVSFARSLVGKNEYDGSADIFWKGIGINWKAKDKPWCAAFAAYCLKKCGVNLSGIAGLGWVPNYKEWGEKNGKYISGKNASASSIKAGDLVIFRGGAHIGLVSKVYADGTYDTIEGNHGNKVAECKGNGKSGHYKIKNTTGFVKIA